MPGPLSHSPADVIARLLVQAGHGSEPANPPGAWPIYVANEPDGPDDCITVYDTQGTESGREMVAGERQEFHGFQVRVRSTTPRVGFLKARAVALTMDQGVYQETVTIDASVYLVHAISRTSDVIPIGKDSPTTKRSLFTVNAKSTLWELTADEVVLVTEEGDFLVE